MSSKHSFFLYLLHPEIMKTISKFTVKMTVAQDERKLNYEGPILSIEDVPGVDSKEARVKFWMITTKL